MQLIRHTFCGNPQVYSFRGQIKTDRSSIGQHVSNNEKQFYLLQTQHFDNRCAGMSVWGIVWVTAKCCLLSYIWSCKSSLCRWAFRRILVPPSSGSSSQRHGFTPQTISIFSNTAVGASNLAQYIRGIRDHFPGDPQIHFCNDYLEVYLILF